MRALSLVVLVAGLVVSGLATPAHADKVDDLGRQLRTDPDYKVRLSAALNLGKLGDRRAVGALTDGLGDADRSVRSVAAAALGKLVDASVAAADRERALAALESAAQGDGDAGVRAQAQRSLAAAQRALRGHGVYVEVGEMADTTQHGAGVIPVMRQQVVSTLGKRVPGYQTRWPSGRSPSETELKKIGATGFFVDASLTQLDVSAGSHVACAVSVILATYPQKSMFAFAKGTAELDAASKSDRAVSAALTECVTAVLDDLVASKVVPTIQARVP
jgi:hypothetical protein